LTDCSLTSDQSPDGQTNVAKTTGLVFKERYFSFLRTHNEAKIGLFPIRLIQTTTNFHPRVKESPRKKFFYIMRRYLYEA